MRIRLISVRNNTLLVFATVRKPLKQLHYSQITRNIGKLELKTTKKCSTHSYASAHTITLRVGARIKDFLTMDTQHTQTQSSKDTHSQAKSSKERHTHTHTETTHLRAAERTARNCLLTDPTDGRHSNTARTRGCACDPCRARRRIVVGVRVRV